MTDVLRIKRRPTGGASGPPASLAAAEIAYNEVNDVLYYGKGNSGGLATSIVAIGGPGAFAVGSFLPLTGGTLTGNLGLFVSPPADANAASMMRLGNNVISYWGTATDGLQLGANVYPSQVSGSNSWKALTTGTCGVLGIDFGSFTWWNAPLTTAGAAPVWVKRMVLDANGNLGLGASPATDAITGSLTLRNGGFIDMDSTGTLQFGANIYQTNSGGIWKYVAAGTGTVVNQSLSGWTWYLTASGSAGASVPGFPVLMQLNASGLNVVTGSLSVNAPTATQCQLILNKATPTVSLALIGQTGGKNRWQLHVGNSQSETGSNVGSDFAVYRYNDDGTYLSPCLTITRSNGWATFNYGVRASDEIQAYKSGAGFRWGTTVGCIWYSDTTTGYLLLTNSGDPLGGWNGLRPFFWNLNSGYVYMQQGVNIAGGLTADAITSTGNITSNQTVYSDGPGRFIAKRGSVDASFCCWNTNAGYAAGMLLGGSNNLYFATMDGSGNYTGYLGYFDTSGNFWAKAALTGTYIHSTGSTVSDGNLTVSSGGLNVNGGEIYAASGNLQARNAACLVATGVYPAYWNNGQFRIYNDSGGPAVISYAGNWLQLWNNQNGNFEWNDWNPRQLLRLEGGGNFVLVNGNAWKPGGGVWNDSSDDRVKKDVEDYTTGLDAIRRLKPIRYRFNGLGGTPDNDKFYTGLSAQAAREVMPELVEEFDFPIDPSGKRKAEHDTSLGAGLTGRLPGQLSLDATPLIYAMLNAIQELAARVEALEAG